MQVFGALLGLLALLALSLFFTHRGLDGALAPLAAVCFAILFFTLAGVLGVLLPAYWLFLAACFGLCALALLRAKGGRKGLVLRLCRPGFCFFAAMGFVALVFYAVRQPVFSWWDEFSFWGTAVKLTKLSGGLYTLAETGWFWTSTEMPGLVVFSWFFEALGPFAPWRVYFAYSLLFFAVFAALAAPFAKRPALTVPLLTVGLLLPFFFLSPQRITDLGPAYLSAYGDLPAGILFGGVLVFYFALRKEGGAPWWALLPLAALALIKDNTFPIALVAGALLAADTLLFCPAGAENRGKLRKGVFIALCFLLPLGLYLGWKGHAAYANAQNAVTGGEATGASPAGALSDSLSQLFGLAPRSEGFARTLSEMGGAFLDGGTTPVSMLGSGLATVVLILGLFLLGFLLAAGRREKLRLLLAAGLSTAGFLGFQFVLLTYFAFLNKYEGGLPDYARYSVSYYAGWLLLALLFLAAAGLDADPDKVVGEEEKTPLSPRVLAARSLTLAAALGTVGLFALRVLPGYSALDYPDRLYAPLREEEAEARALVAEVPAEGRIFYVNQQDDGFGWFCTHYYLLPHILDYSGGGGRIAPEEGGMRGFTHEELAAYLGENDCGYIYIDGLDEGFIEEYGALFTEGLGDFSEGPALYRRNGEGLYEPVG